MMIPTRVSRLKPLLLWLLLLAGAARAETAGELLGRAYTEAGRLRAPEQQALALADIAAAQQAAGLAEWEKTLGEAIAAAREPEDHLARAMACRGVALRVWTCAPPLAAQVLQAALKLARDLPYAAEKALALREIGRSFTELDPALSATAFTEAEAAAAKIESPLFRSAALRDLAAALPPAQREQARKLFVQAAEALASVQPADDPVQLARIELAVACCPVDLELALKEAAAVPEEALREVCYRRMCETLCAVNAEQAMQVAGRLQQPGQRALAMAALAAPLAATQPEAAAGMARSALKMQEGLSSEDQACLQGSVAVTVARLDVKEGLQLAAAIEDEALAGRALGQIALFVLKTDPPQAAALAAAIADWECREATQAQVAGPLASRDLPAALKLVDALQSRRDRVRALLAIAAAAGAQAAP